MRTAVDHVPFERLSEPAPHVHLLSNGRYTVLLTAAGAGYDAFEGHALTRWAADRTRDADGCFLYVRDLDEGVVWSAGHQPVQHPPDRYDARFHVGKAELVRLDAGIETLLEVCVAPGDDVALRRMTLVNQTDRPRRLDLTTYAEVVLNDPAADAAHPAFSKLFVQTEYDAAGRALLARRRPRSPDEAPPWLMHRLVEEAPADDLYYETDRARFLGRGRTPTAPRAMDPGVHLSGTTGNVLDAVVSLRREITLPPRGRTCLTLVQGAAGTRAAVGAMARRYAAPAVVEEAFQQAAAAAQHELTELGLSGDDVHRLRRLAAALCYGNPALSPPPANRTPGAVPAVVRRAYGLTAGRPLVLLHVAHGEQVAAIRLVRQGLAYWARRGLAAELLVLVDEPSETYLEAARRAAEAVAGSAAKPGVPTRIRRAAEVSEADLRALHAAARVYLDGDLARLRGEADVPGTVRLPANQEAVRHRAAEPAPAQVAPAPEEQLTYFNGYGGFGQEDDAYVIRLEPDEEGALTWPPLPWANVVANESTGFLATERGAGYTWSVNSRENRLTPWYNDPVCDPSPEALYLRDEEARVYWSPTPGPVPGGAAYEVRHGLGYTIYRHESRGLAQEVCLFVPRHDPVKIARVQVTNRSGRARRLVLFAYHRWVLGVLPSESTPSVVTDVDPETRALFAVNPDNQEFSGRVAFAAVLPAGQADPVTFTADRTAFLGRHGSPEQPAALQSGAALDGRAGVGLDPCAAFQVPFTLPPGETFACSVLLGEEADRAAARALVERYRQEAAVRQALDAVRSFWKETVAGVRIETPEKALDLMVNAWLPYQNLSCRLWGRSAYYQSGGAFGFRDQLQDAAALVYLMPERTRAQILLHAAHQFVEGDVMHWWHPPTSKGIRTRFSDDLLWLPYVTAFYVRTTGDASLLDEPARLLTARSLEPGEDEVFLTPHDAGEEADVYAHCCRALDRSLTRGAHGLPLMGTGDWNDGMNRVGREGRGESVWVGFFLFDILRDFIPRCAQRGDDERAARYRAYRAHLAEALNGAGWDGGWYRRAYYDDGAPLGSAESDECRIDALAQAWAVLSGAAPPERGRMALDAMEAQLVSEDEGLIRLLTPAFDQTPHDPGYIKGYVPGVRENGGQYTHAALWAVRALADDGRRDRAARLLTMLSPVSHGRTRAAADVYKVEPYVVAADVYGVAPHVGRGGWTWYTGSAGWMYRVALESILGFQLVEGRTLVLRPCIPDAWPGFTLRYRVPGTETVYAIDVRNPEGHAEKVVAVTVEGVPLPPVDGAAHVPLRRDDALHRVAVTLGAG